MNLTQFQFLISLLLPLPIVLIAGILRQDKFNPLVNEGIAWAVTFLSAGLSVAFGVGGHLTGNIQLDFVTVTAYAGLLAHSSLLKPLQMYLQSNLLSLGVAEASKIEQTTIADVKASLDRLNAFFTGASQNPQPQVAQAPVQQLTFPAQNPNFGVIPPTASQFAASPQSSYPLAALGRELPATPQPPKG